MRCRNDATDATDENAADNRHHAADTDVADTDRDAVDADNAADHNTVDTADTWYRFYQLRTLLMQ